MKPLKCILYITVNATVHVREWQRMCATFLNRSPMLFLSWDWNLKPNCSCMLQPKSNLTSNMWSWSGTSQCKRNSVNLNHQHNSRLNRGHGKMIITLAMQLQKDAQQEWSMQEIIKHEHRYYVLEVALPWWELSTVLNKNNTRGFT